ncbi:MAG: hypothetical protein Tsb005_15070 [Gammaproteobacteria bacterium]
MQHPSSLLDMIGNTPIVELTQFDTGQCRLFIKLEYYNPGGSIKDRIAKAMIEDAEQSGQLKPGMTIVEATAGNTGLGLAMMAVLKGYHLLLVLPDKMSKEKVDHLRAMGVEIRMTRSDVEKGHPEYYQDLAQHIAQENSNMFYINQFGNPANPRAHETTTGPEIWQQMQHDLDAIVYGVGSSGTMTGLGRYFHQVAPDLELILADPQGSILADLINTGQHQTPGKWLVEGIGEDFVPSICDLSYIKKAYTVTDAQSMQAGRELLRRTGIFAGSSTGTHLHAALAYCREQSQPKKVLTIACDSGNKYLSKMYNDDWMRQHNLLK